MQLFDSFERTEHRLGRHGEPHFPYLNETARVEGAQVRSLIETWFDDYPMHEREEFRPRFRATDNRTHSSAFFELYMHALLRTLGYNLDVHPQVPNTTRRPDFLVTGPQGHFYCEAVVASDVSDADAGALARRNELLSALDEADSPDFFIQLDTEGDPTAPLPLRTIRTAAERFLATLDPDVITKELQGGAELYDLPTLELEYHGCTIHIRGFPKSPTSRGKPGIRSLGMSGSGMEQIDSSAALRDAALSKASRYGRPNLPYLIAVNARSSHLDRISIMDALFGRETFVATAARGELTMVRSPNGLWYGTHGARYSRVSAVLVAYDTNPWNVAARVPLLVHNPGARHSLAASVLELPSARADSSKNRMEFRDGIWTPHRFGITEEWPRGSGDHGATSR